MTTGYALQIVGIIAGMGLVALTALRIASANFDRHTREIEKREAVDSPP